MRKIAVILCIVAALLSFCGCKKNYTHGVYEVTIKADRISYDHVGNEWKKVYTCEGRTIKSGEQWTVPLDTTKTLKINATITELDAWDDVGYGSLNVVLRDDFETSTIVTVTEDNGRYQGNKAKWEITCSVELVKKLEQK